VPSFKDSAGTVWPVEISYAAIERAEAEGVSLGELLSNSQKIAEALFDHKTFPAVLWAVCNPEPKGLTPKAFKELLSGPVVHDAARALVEAVADFTQPPRVAAGVKAKTAETYERIQTEAVNRIEKLTWSPSGGKSPDSAA